MIGHRACAAGGPRSGLDGLPGPARCLIVIGTRQEAITLFPVVHALQDSPYFDPFVVVTSQATGQYEPVLELAGIEADADLRCEPHGRTVNRVIAGLVSRFDDLLTQLRGGPERRRRPRLGVLGSNSATYPSAAIVHGASTSALGAALAATGAHIPVVSVTADDCGTASGPGTADFNQRLVSRLASFHMTPTSTGLSRLVAEGTPVERIFITGDPRVDAFRWSAARGIAWPDPRLVELDDPGCKVVVADIRHAPGSESWHRIAEALGQIAAVRRDVLTVVPLNPEPRLRATLIPSLAGLRNVIITEPLSYAAFARLVARADLAISDSRSLQEEAPSVGTPLLVLGDGHRQEAVEAGCVRPVPADPVALADSAIGLLDRTTAYERMRQAPNPFGDGAAGRRVAAALEHLIFDSPPPAPFGVAFSRRRVLAAAGFSEADVSSADSHSHAGARLVALERPRV